MWVRLPPILPIKFKIMSKVIKLKEYMFTFEEGGWNTCWAKTFRGAKKEAVRQYKDYPTLNPKVSSVHLATEQGLKSAMSLFY